MKTRKIHLSDCAFGYVFKNGKYDKPYIFLKTNKNMAAFIKAYTNDKIRISDANDHDLVTVDHGIVDQKHSDMETVKKIETVSENTPLEFLEKKYERYQKEIATQMYVEI